MTLAIIARALQAGLAKLGEPSLLDGANVGPVNIEYGVDMFVGDPGRGDDNYSAHVNVATITGSTAKVGQVLVHPDGTFVLSKLVEDNGYNRQFIVVSQ